MLLAYFEVQIDFERIQFCYTIFDFLETMGHPYNFIRIKLFRFSYIEKNQNFLIICSCTGDLKRQYRINPPYPG